ncbi:MAG: hypothetical protein GY869_10980 [Planctomycetes bacterium]|nr:hypothetical protein [Planctomycetota bacterium]
MNFLETLGIYYLKFLLPILHDHRKLLHLLAIICIPLRHLFFQAVDFFGVLQFKLVFTYLARIQFRQTLF